MTISATSVSSDFAQLVLVAPAAPTNHLELPCFKPQPGGGVDSRPQTSPLPGTMAGPPAQRSEPGRSPTTLAGSPQNPLRAGKRDTLSTGHCRGLGTSCCGRFPRAAAPARSADAPSRRRVGGPRFRLGRAAAAWWGRQHALVHLCGYGGALAATVMDTCTRTSLAVAGEGPWVSAASAQTPAPRLT